VIQAIAAEDTWPLRRDALHPDRPLSVSLDPLDAQPESLHLGWFAAGRLVGVATISRHPLPLDPAVTDWFVRGMAVAQDWRSQGIGGQLLASLLAHAAARDPKGIAWCHARLPAKNFYLRHGFRILDEVNLPEKGPRLRMRRALVLD
jgi:GNAT superfamily N-acetyltransferase